ncbi:LpxI family protein [Algicella marina]|uniref:DUF1009 domain-containing protein n=1 Tax=Algicella marina TaxID=2683284 RepID=A0A6P1SYL8_9RHOB|nr:UDP-2,3-diacylglucosamine diphosphatase LpxI [Algicella marina]QHQ34720.1 DUF1009 domain-containing protein [Algicella marina]
MADKVDGLAIVAGSGVLPRMLAEDCKRSGRAYAVIKFEGIALDWVTGHPVIPAVFEKPGRLFKDIARAGLKQVTFAGGMSRPKISPLRFDLTGIRLAPKLFKALKGGDDAALRIVTEIFEAEGLSIVAAHELLESLLVPEGVLTKGQPSDADKADAARAAAIVEAIGAVDVGQGAVVAQGICLGLESIQGTDAMLAHVAATGGPFRPDAQGAKGVLLKAPKPGQDWRTDLPAIGPDTLRNAHSAGLAGVVIEAGGVLVLGREEVVAQANALEMFLWSRPRGT